ncbi:MAG: hypothetical protein V1773_01020 [bacterium]
MKWIPFFRTGPQTDSLGREKLWTNEEIDLTINNYNSLGEEEKRPIVIGHPKENIPIVGYINKIKRINDTLYAMPGLVANSFKKLVNDGQFPERSISFNMDGTVNHFGFLPKGINGAVKNLGNYSFSKEENLCSSYSFIDEEMDLLEETEEINENDILRIEAELEVINNQIEKLTGNKNAGQTEKSLIYNKIEKMNDKIENSSFMEKLSSSVNLGNISPALKNKLMELYNFIKPANPEFTENNKGKIEFMFEEIIDLIKNRVEFDELVIKNNNKQLKSELDLLAETYKL